MLVYLLGIIQCFLLNYLYHKRQYYVQKSALSMGASSCSILSEIYIEHLEHTSVIDILINHETNVYVLLTVHLTVFISVINQLDAQNVCFTISLFHAPTCFEHMFSSSGGQNCITQLLVSSHL